MYIYGSILGFSYIRPPNLFYLDIRFLNLDILKLDTTKLLSCLKLDHFRFQLEPKSFKVFELDPP